MNALPLWDCRVPELTRGLCMLRTGLSGAQVLGAVRPRISPELLTPLAHTGVTP